MQGDCRPSEKCGPQDSWSTTPTVDWSLRTMRGWQHRIGWTFVVWFVLFWGWDDRSTATAQLFLDARPNLSEEMNSPISTDLSRGMDWEMSPRRTTEPSPHLARNLRRSFGAASSLETKGDLADANADDEFSIDLFPSIAWLPRRGANGFGMVDLAATRLFKIPLDEKWGEVSVSPGIAAHIWNGPNGIALPSTVYDAYLEVDWTHAFSEEWSLQLNMTPGFYGDFRRWDHGAIVQTNGSAVLEWQATPTVSVQAGAIYLRQFHPHYLPVLGIDWRPNPDTRLELIFPEPRLSRRIWQRDGQQMWIYALGQIAGGAWSVTPPSGPTGVVRYSDLRAGVGLEVISKRELSGSIEAGYVFDRNLVTPTIGNFSPSNTLYFEISLQR